MHAAEQNAPVGNSSSWLQPAHWGHNEFAVSCGSVSTEGKRMKPPWQIPFLIAVCLVLAVIAAVVQVIDLSRSRPRLKAAKDARAERTAADEGLGRSLAARV
jgi:hypothetical protein